MNSKTGFWGAFGALVGGAVGATGAKFVAEARPRYSYAIEQRAPGTEIEDAMMVGGAAGALLGAFMGAAVAAPEEPEEVLAPLTAGQSPRFRYP